MSRLKVYHNNGFIYADMTSQGGGVSPDIVVSGTYTYNDEFPNQTDILGATFSTSLSMSELLAKVASKGTLTIGGFLTKTEDYGGQTGYTMTHYAPLRTYASLIANETLTGAIGTMLSLTIDSQTQAIRLKVSNEYNSNGAAISLIIYQSNGSVAFEPTTSI